MQDLRSPTLIKAKAGLFLVTEYSRQQYCWIAPRGRSARCWRLPSGAFCRLYYFVFYVVERYLEPDRRASGILSRDPSPDNDYNKRLKSVRPSLSAVEYAQNFYVRSFDRVSRDIRGPLDHQFARFETRPGLPSSGELPSNSTCFDHFIDTNCGLRLVLLDVAKDGFAVRDC